jgi:iron(III) transport system ATP-binding protein
MLRPEQLQLTAVPADPMDTDAEACLGVVEDIDFGGALCGLTVRLCGEAYTHTAPLLVRSPAIHIPPVGATVQITVMGRAHVFAV